MPDAALRILVVEDHPALGRFIAAVLAGTGLSVVGPFCEHASALEAAEGVAVDLALIDWTLRGQDAIAIIDAAVRRGIPCLLSSGYPRSALPERLRDVPFLEKPFTKETLLDAVRAAADNPA